MKGIGGKKMRVEMMKLYFSIKNNFLNKKINFVFYPGKKE